MAVRFAVASGNWSSGATWDGGTVPSIYDDIHANGYSVNIDQNINFLTLRNTATSQFLQDNSVPLMETNTYPSGVCKSSNNSLTAFYVFDRNDNTTHSFPTQTGWTSYQFTTQKTIRRYVIRPVPGSQSTYQAYNWTFQASNDEIEWVTIHTVIANAISSTRYISPVLNNNTGFTYYRIFATAQQFNLNMGGVEMTESSGATGGNSGGGYVIPASSSGTTTINSSGDGLISNGTTTVLTINSPSGTTVNLTKDAGNGIYIVGPNWRNSDTAHSAILINTNTTVNYIGDLWGNQVNGRNGLGTLRIAGAANFNLYGNIYPSITTNTFCFALVCAGNGATVNIIGSIYGSTATNSFNTAVNNLSNSTINIIGNVIGNYGYAFRNFDGTNTFGAGPLNVQGVVQTNSTSAAAAIYSESTSLSSSLITLSGPVINTNNTMAVYANRLRFYSGTTTQWRFQDTANATRVLYQSGYTGTTIGLPASIDVRKNTVYGQYNEFTGTLVVPSPSDVRINVLTDNTVGTGQLTAEDFLNAITASTLPIAVRLQNISTTQTMGTQLAALSGRT